VFVTRRVLEGLNRYAFPAGPAGVLGFIVGDLCHCPRTGILYVALDRLVSLPQPVYGDKTGTVTANVWPTLQQHVTKLKRHLLGWYHSHPPLGVALAPGDVDAHLAYFPLRWQVALVVALGESGVDAGFFRPTPEAVAPDVPLHFFEVLDPRVLTADGRRRSFVHWQNYEVRRRAEVHVATARALAETPPVASLSDSTTLEAEPTADPAAAESDDVMLDLPDVVAPSPDRRQAPDRRTPVATPRPAELGRARRAVRWPILIGLAAAGAFVLLGRATFRPDATPGAVVRAPDPAAAARLESVPLAPPPGSAPGPDSHPPVAPALSGFAAASDALAADLRDYQSRGARFEQRLIKCQDLADAFATVEQRWITYSVERRKLAGQLDPAQVAADTAFSAAMDSVESSYERSACPRP
jgi:hypothetical protein